VGEPKWTVVDKPCIVGRWPFGRIFIANSDAAGRAYADAAIDEAHCAVSELMRV
jgi:spermidine dehydrogenase